MAVKFRGGQLVATPGAISAVEAAGESMVTFLDRHFSGDWGDLDEEDVQSNESALETGERLFSAYKLANAEKIYIITEWDRSATTVLLPGDY